MTDHSNGKAVASHAPKSRKSKLLASAVLAGSLTLLAACGEKQPEGQVVAVLNGDEVTLQEVNAALQSNQIPEGQDETTARNAALQNVINRRLMAGVARDEGIENTPEYIVRRRQVEEALLVQMLSQNISRDLEQPSAQEVDAFIGENPQMFAERKVFAANQIRFPTPERDDYLEALTDTTNMDQVVAALNRLGIQFQRGNTRIDSGNMPTELFQQVVAVGSREPIIVPAGPFVTVSQILQMQDAPIADDNARQVALNTMSQRAVAEALRERLDTAKEEAGIDYQPGYGPVEGDDAADLTSDGATDELTPSLTE